MKVLLLSEYQHLEIADLPEPAPGPGEVLVRVAACGICGSDVHGFDGSTGRRIPPIVMGHEAAGRIAAGGDAGGGFRGAGRAAMPCAISRRRSGSPSIPRSIAATAPTAAAAPPTCATAGRCWAYR